MTKQWILDCYKRKTAISWLKYNLKSKNDNTNSETEDEEKGRDPKDVKKISQEPKAGVSPKKPGPRPASTQKVKSK